MKKLMLTSLFLSATVVVCTTANAADKSQSTDACAGSPPPSKFIIVNEVGSAMVSHQGDVYQVKLDTPKVTFLSDDPCVKQKIANWSSSDFGKVSKLLSSYDRYITITGESGQFLIGRVKSIAVDGNKINYSIDKMYGNGKFNGRVNQAKVFLMEVQYKDVLFIP